MWLDLLASVHAEWEGYGFAEQAHWRAVQIDVDEEATRFVVQHQHQRLGTMRSVLVGQHNIQNALGVIAVASHLGLSFETIHAGLQSFTGVKRRQEVRGIVREITVIDDFAHHPTAIGKRLPPCVPSMAGGACGRFLNRARRPVGGLRSSRSSSGRLPRPIM